MDEEDEKKVSAETRKQVAYIRGTNRAMMLAAVAAAMASGALMASAPVMMPIEEPPVPDQYPTVRGYGEMEGSGARQARRAAERKAQKLKNRMESRKAKRNRKDTRYP